MIGIYIKYNVNYVHSLALKTNFYFEPYHRILTNYHHRSVITKFRIIYHLTDLKSKLVDIKIYPKKIVSVPFVIRTMYRIHFLFGCPHLNAQRHELSDLWIIKCPIFQSLSSNYICLDSNKWRPWYFEIACKIPV